MYSQTARSTANVAYFVKRFQNRLLTVVQRGTPGDAMLDRCFGGNRCCLVEFKVFASIDCVLVTVSPQKQQTAFALDEDEGHLDLLCLCREYVSWWCHCTVVLLNRVL
jgi:hypothetical protein